MTGEMRQKVAMTWVSIARIYGKELATDTLRMMVDAVSDLDADQVISALREWNMKSKFGRYPYPAEVRDLVHPELSAESLSNEVATRILQAIKDHGYSNRELAKGELGDLCWSVVDRHGGWTRICEDCSPEGVRLANFRATAKSIAEARKIGVADVPPQLPKFENKLAGLINSAIKVIPSNTTEGDKNV